jgi:predicted RNA-binding protein YlqC (UPF0109 family)/cold shock CspA family protein
MKDLVRMIVGALVEFPDDVDILEIEGPNTTILEIKVSKQDVGKLLGKKGRNITALRNIVSAAGKGKKNYIIEVSTENGPKSDKRVFKGKIQRLFEDRDYGFIEADDGRSIYFHISSLKGVGIQSLSPHQPVEFVVEEGIKGIRAVKVVPMNRKGN